MATKDKPSELHKLQFDYAWKWFCFHADQRIKMFNFMLIVFGIFAAGVVNALDKNLPTVAIAGLCFFAMVLALIFTRLDRRNRVEKDSAPKRSPIDATNDTPQPFINRRACTIVVVVGEGVLDLQMRL